MTVAAPTRRKAAPLRTPLKPTIVETLAEQVIRFVETFCVYPEGRLVGQSIKLPEYHKRAIRGIYAEVEPGVFKHRLSIISWPRKQAKTGLMASLLLAHLVGPVAIKNAQVYSCAFSEDQAAILFRYAEKMILQSPELSARIRIRPSGKRLFAPKTGVVFRALSSKDKTSYGLSPQVTFFDETGQAGAVYPQWDAMETAKGAVFNPMTVIISTQAADDIALLSTLIDDAPKDPSVFLDLVQCPEDIDPLDETRLHEWLPAWNEAWCNTQEIISMCRRAARLPSERSRYLNLIANRRVRGADGLVTPEIWDANGTLIPDAQIEGRRAWAGLDLSQTTDLTAWVLVIPLDNGKIAVRAHFWLPEDGIDERALKDKVNYRVWAEQGHLTLVPGKVIGYEWVVSQIMADAARFNIVEIAFDRYRIKNLEKAAADEGAVTPKLVEFGQGFVSMAPALQELENSLLREELAHGMQPILRWNIANAVVVRDPAGNRKFDKSKRTQRIDGAVALAMAIGQYRKSATKRADVAAMIG
jgi:phage terminase large subunit-like protein